MNGAVRVGEWKLILGVPNLHKDGRVTGGALKQLGDAVDRETAGSQNVAHGLFHWIV